MKLPKVIALVLTMHVAVIGVLLLSPGCKTTDSGTFVADDATNEMAHEGNAPHLEQMDESTWQQDTSLDPAFNAGIEQEADALPADAQAQRIVSTNSTDRPRLPPTRPEWGFQESNPVAQPQGASAAANVNIREISEPSMQPSSTSQSSMMKYTVKSGDSFWKISRKFQVSLDELLQANNMTKNSIIQPGQVLAIPGVPEQTSRAAPQPVVRTSGDRVHQDVGGLTYTVLTGDTLSEIAKIHGVTVQAIKAVNNMQGSRIVAGQELVLPSGATMPELDVRQQAPSQRNTSSRSVPSDGLNYTVERGDTLSSIAKQFGVTIKQIQELNGITDPRKLQVGQELLIKKSIEGSIRRVLTPAEDTEPTFDEDGIDEGAFGDDAPPTVELRRLD